MMIYKMIENPKSSAVAEEMLNNLSKDGWIVIGFTQYQILLENWEEDEDQDMVENQGDAQDMVEENDGQNQFDF